ncbi:MAG: SulP family inorganic anion transporter, partial [Reyranellales bacterium]
MAIQRRSIKSRRSSTVRDFGSMAGCDMQSSYRVCRRFPITPSNVIPWRGGDRMTRWMPGLVALRDYKLSYLPHDLGAGLTLGAVMVPVGLAYGELAGLPLAGLYGSMLP